MGMHIDGIYEGPDSSHSYGVFMPACNGDGLAAAAVCNAAFGGGFLHFHQPVAEGQ